MKASENFVEAIKFYLDGRAKQDSQFAVKYSNANKSVEQCCSFIIDEVYKSGRNAMTDDEVFGLAVHYYDEENIGTITEHSAKVVVPKHGAGESRPKPQPKQTENAQLSLF